ncbi:uncharacterized protein LOC110245309 [Exaiptasia diaphana]|uniref:F5/8 type C domain-containing protein n=1 Tax=Exaiptasia diaphana TaxID=2652724 RepID=A0A913XPD9_EXADI|nr:uncharacterized protein LOC110245309 [Exaiptasia diaphana]KXJ25461.1 hypothetical protein AC249_AIPGENE6972 [Exaiptasia diaphana]
MYWFMVAFFHGLFILMLRLSSCSAGCEGLDSVAGSCSTIGNCTAETGQPPSIVECYDRPQNMHICTFETVTDRVPKELGVKVAENVFQLPDAHFTASSNQDNAKYARIGLPSNKTWCADNANQWLEIDLGTVVTVTRIELVPVGNTDAVNFTVTYRTNSSNPMQMYLSGSEFRSTANNTCHHLFIMNTDTIRINSKTSNSCFRLAVYGQLPDRLNTPQELGVGVPLGPSPYYRIPDSKFKASSNQEDAKYARVGLKGDKRWCAATNDKNPWLEIVLDVAKTVERIDVQGDPTRLEVKFWLSYKTQKTGVAFTDYRNRKIFTSKNGSSTHYISITEPYSIRINLNTSKPCLRVAIYGDPKRDNYIKEVVQVVPVPVTTQPTAIFLGRDSLSSSDFHKGFVIWVLFLAVFVFLLLVFLTFLFCWCCRREREFQPKSEKVTRVTSTNYVPSWRTIDAKAEKGYIATQEVQEVKIAFGDEYIPPDLKKEKLDPNDEDNYRHKIFSFRGWEGTKTPAIKVEKPPSIQNE